MANKIPIVSVITPCYNGAAYLHRYFDSILQQNYSAMQLIFIDDGSIDNTYEIAESYREQLEAKGIKFELLHQSNCGQASALNTGFKAVIGDYITWPDSDDIMASDCISSKVRYLENHPDKGFVRSSLEVVTDTNLSQVTETMLTDAKASPFIFDDLVHDRGPFFSGVAYMARTALLFKVLNGRHIYESRTGQNWQLLMPLAHASQCGFIEKPLGKYVIRENSHSRSYQSLERQYQRTLELEDLLRHILINIPLSQSEEKSYTHYIDVKYQKQRFWLAIALGRYNLAAKADEVLTKEYGRSYVREFYMSLTRLGFGASLYRLKRFVSRIRNAMRRLWLRLMQIVLTERRSVSGESPQMPNIP